MEYRRRNRYLSDLTGAEACHGGMGGDFSG